MATKKKVKKASRKSTKNDRMQTAAIAAVLMELNKARSGVAPVSRGGQKAPREAWKMAGRAARLGITSF